MTQPTYSAQKGDVWRTSGDFGWVKVTSVQLPGHREYDGATSGVCVQISDSGGRGWKRGGWFVLARDDADFETQMRHGNYRRWLSGVDTPPLVPAASPEDWEDEVLP